GSVTVDVAYGGMFYVIASAERFGLQLTPDEGADIVRITEMIKAAAKDQLPVVHPEQPGFAGITIGQLSGPAHDQANTMRNVVTVSTGVLDWDRPATWTGAIDRSPCGTGTCARMATLYARGRARGGRGAIRLGRHLHLGRDRRRSRRHLRPVGGDGGDGDDDRAGDARHDHHSTGSPPPLEAGPRGALDRPPIERSSGSAG